MAPLPDDEITLQLDYWPDELSPAQKAAYEKAEKEHNDVLNKLKEIVKESSGKNIFSGEVFSAYQILGPVPGLDKISKPLSSLSKKKKEPPAPTPPPVVAPESPPPVVDAPKSTRSGKSRRSDYKVDPEPDNEDFDAVDDDDEEYVPLSKRAKAKEKEKVEREARSVVAAAKKVPEAKGKAVEKKSAKVTKPPAPHEKSQSITTSHVRPTEATAVGGLAVGADKEKKPKDAPVVDLTKDDGAKVAADSREISFSRIQGKTFPSLVVIARPSLKVNDKAAADRTQLDAKVKNVLMHTATKFTEWLIQQGLVKSEQGCLIHKSNNLKLGMYSDASKFPYSGGYVWISECCPTRFISVFNGSIFEGSAHPPSVILKLIYHWSCQTNVSNVVNWVKVDNLYVKGLYTWLRSVCTVALNQHMNLMGGIGKKIEVGVISLGTTTQDGQQRQVKVEVLGVLDPEAKQVRLRAVEPLNDGERNYKKRFSKILEPLSNWVHKDSVILTDLTVDKGTLNNMGYKIVQQVSPADANSRNSNSNIMDYLRRIVPRMFQNTLSLLSRQIIQQFLNELVWREWYGSTPGLAFDNIVLHIAEQTRIDTKDNLVARLNKAAADPFKHWTYPTETASPSTSGKRNNRKRGKESSPPPPPPPPPEPAKKVVPKKAKAEEKAPPSKKTKASEEKEPKPSDDSIPLESYYYGIIDNGIVSDNAENITFRAQCPECPVSYDNNIDFQDHLFSHAVVTTDDQIQCRYCLESWANAEALKKHTILVHPCETKNSIASTFNCIICELRFSTVQMLSSHMQKNHLQFELPYKCAGCDYRSSSHHLTIDHFYESHGKSGVLQCPFCLKMVLACNRDGAINENIHDFLKHVKLHLNRTLSKKCTKCSLHFIKKGPMKVHHLFGHIVSSDNVKVMCKNSTYITRPRLKNSYQKELTLFKTVESHSTLILEMENGKICLECENDFDEENHIIGTLKCLKCNFMTCCLPTMLEHATSCNPNAVTDSYTVSPLDTEMHCICGFSSSDGNALARHLVTCDRKSVYATMEAALENTVKRNMLDMLGLVRREDENLDDSLEPEAEAETPSQQPTYEQEQPQEPMLIENDNDISVNQSLYNVEAGEQQFNTQLSLDDLGPPSVLPPTENDRTPQLRDDYQSLATPRVPHMEADQPDYDPSMSSGY